MATAKTNPASNDVGVIISAPNLQAVRLKLVGTAPLMMARFSQKAMLQMSDKMTGVVKKGTKVRAERDFNDDYEQAFHKSMDGWTGIPCSALRAACISACRLVGFQMTRAKLSIFVIQEGLDAVDGLPLFQLYGTPEQTKMAVRNATGVADLRVRPMWREWYAYATIQFDGDQFALQDVINLLSRAGQQVGLLEGRPDSKSSAGLGFGTFRVEADDTEAGE